MKTNKVLSISILILLIVLISLVSFVGIFKIDKNKVYNILPDYLLGEDFSSSRVVTYTVDETSETKNYDENGNEIVSSGEDEEEETNVAETKEVPVNAPEVLTKENYDLTKKIIEDRVKALGISEYEVRVSSENGNIALTLPENSRTDIVLQYLTSKGNFEVVDSETNEVLLNNADLKEAKPMYYTSTNGTTIYLNIKFNKEATKKLENISRTYVSATDEEGNTTNKKVTMKLDDTEILSTYFDEPITTGDLQISIGSATTDKDELQDYLLQASNLGMLLKNEQLPIQYTAGTNKVLQPAFTQENIKMALTIAIIVFTIIAIIIVIRFKENGIIATIASVGYIALLLLLIRFTKVTLTMEGAVAIALSVILNVVFIVALLKKLEKETSDSVIKKTILDYAIKFIPLYIIAIVFCFSTNLAVASFGTVIFWSIVSCGIINILFTRTMILLSQKEKKSSKN